MVPGGLERAQSQSRRHRRCIRRIAGASVFPQMGRRLAFWLAGLGIDPLIGADLVHRLLQGLGGRQGLVADRIAVCLRQFVALGPAGLLMTVGNLQVAAVRTLDDGRRHAGGHRRCRRLRCSLLRKGFADRTMFALLSAADTALVCTIRIGAASALRWLNKTRADGKSVRIMVQPAVPA